MPFESFLFVTICDALDFPQESNADRSDRRVFVTVLKQIGNQEGHLICAKTLFETLQIHCSSVLDDRDQFEIVLQHRSDITQRKRTGVVVVQR